MRTNRKDIKNQGQDKTCINVQVEVDVEVSWRRLEGLQTSQNRSRWSQKSIWKASAKLLGFLLEFMHQQTLIFCRQGGGRLRLQQRAPAPQDPPITGKLGKQGERSEVGGGETRREAPNTPATCKHGGGFSATRNLSSLELSLMARISCRQAIYPVLPRLA